MWVVVGSARFLRREIDLAYYFEEGLPLQFESLLAQLAAR
jgi:hypothetical protein